MKGKILGFEEISEYKNHLIKAIDSISVDKIKYIVQEILSTRMTQNNIFIAGNGGSASIASHFATDFMFGSKLVNPGLKVISLVENASILTATGNDLSFADIFSRQLNILGKNGDLLILISSSGNSSNILNCIEVCKEIGIKTIGLSGFDGGLLSQKVDLSLHISTEIGMYGVVEDTHMIVGHIITQLLRNKIS